MAVRKTHTGSALSTLSGITLYLLHSAARIAPLFRPDKKLEIVYPVDRPSINMVADRVRLAFSRDDRLFLTVGFSKRG